MLGIKLALMFIFFSYIIYVFTVCTCKRKVIKNEGESRTRVVDSEKVAVIKREAVLLMEREAEEDQMKGKCLKNFLESLKLWEAEEVKYGVCIRGMAKNKGYYWRQMAKNKLCPIYYCSDSLIFADESGIIRELDTGFLRVQYSTTVKECVFINLTDKSLTLPCEERFLLYESLSTVVSKGD